MVSKCIGLLLAAFAARASAASVYCRLATCSATAKDQCSTATDCQWSQDSCGASEAASKEMSGLLLGNPEVLKVMTTCMAASDKSTCVAAGKNCHWQKGDSGAGQCSASNTYTMSVLHGSTTPLMTATMDCAVLAESATCTANAKCKWKDSDKDCEITEAASLAALPAENRKKVEAAMKCKDFKDKSTCTADTHCAWKGTECDASREIMLCMVGCGICPGVASSERTQYSAAGVLVLSIASLIV